MMEKRIFFFVPIDYNISFFLFFFTVSSDL